ncbi:MAG TPA: hypothetical protein DG754_00650 [Bacteroidales bacterium]|jgi:hypothetical protein|nr:hypothetical protein [Bacteroidales bacterium]
MLFTNVHKKSYKSNLNLATNVTTFCLQMCTPSNVERSPVKVIDVRKFAVDKPVIFRSKTVKWVKKVFKQQLPKEVLPKVYNNIDTRLLSRLHWH